MATEGALAVLRLHGIDPLEVYSRHACGDWGDVGAEDKKANDRALEKGGRVFSCYRVGEVTVYVITKNDKSVTKICLGCDLIPEVY